MKPESRQSHLAIASHASKHRALRSALLSLVCCTTSLVSCTPAFAADRIFQILGACQRGTAEFIGSSKKGRSQLTSASTESIAGFHLDGLEGKTVSELKDIEVTFEPPPGNVTEFTMRVTYESGAVDRIQNFHIGNETFPKLPNLPVRQTGAGLSVEISNDMLIGGKSRLTGDEVIRKVSFIYNSKALGAVYKQFIDNVEYDRLSVPLILQPVTCTLR